MTEKSKIVKCHVCKMLCKEDDVITVMDVNNKSVDVCSKECARTQYIVTEIVLNAFNKNKE